MSDKLRKEWEKITKDIRLGDWKRFKFTDQVMIGKVHNHIIIIKLIDSEPHIADKEKGKFKWVPTIIESNRLEKFRPICEIEMARMVME